MTSIDTLTSEPPAIFRLREEILSLSTALLDENAWKKFVSGLDMIGGLLSKFDPAPSPLIAAFDQKGQDFPTYYYAGFSATKDFEKSINIYKAVKLMVRYILFMDRYYEVGERKCLYIAKGIMTDIKNSFPNGHAGYSIEYSFKQFWPFWDYEQSVKRLMLKGDQEFCYRELRHFNLFKSSDAPIIYCNLLDNQLPYSIFNQDVAKVFHYNQALQDIHDDFLDIQEDIADKMPNIFLLSAVNSTASNKLFSASTARDRMKIKDKILANDSVIEPIETLVNDYLHLIKQTHLPDEFIFLKHLAHQYAENILTVLNPAT